MTTLPVLPGGLDSAAGKVQFRETSLDPLLRGLFHGLDTEGAVWCVLRRTDELDRPAGDVDLLVHPGTFEACRRALVGSGFAELPSAGRGTHSFFVAYDGSRDQWICVDVVTALAYGRSFELKVDAAVACLTQRRRVASTYALSRTDEFWALFLHCLLDKRAFPEDDRGRLLDAAEVALTGSALLNAIRHACPDFEPESAVSAVRSRDWDSLTRLSPQVERKWRRRQRLGSLKSRAAALLGRLHEAWIIGRRRRGLVVAFLGVDGAGKSTLIEALHGSFPFPSRVIYGGMWQSVGRSGIVWTARRLARPLVRPAGLWYRYLLASGHRAVGRFVFFDRYTYDAYLPVRGPHVALKRIYFWLLAHCIPSPDLVVLVDVPGTVAAARRPEEDEAALERDRLRLLALAEKLPRLVVLDGARDAGAVRREVTELLWHRYRARWNG